jgi:carbamoyltransferase
VGVISEERFDRKKNSTAFPTQSIAYLLKTAGKEFKDIDLVVSASRVVPFTNPEEIQIYEEERRGQSKNIKTRIKRIINDIYYRVPISRDFIRWMYKAQYDQQFSDGAMNKVRTFMTSKMSVPTSQIIFADHHLCHAYAGYYGFVPIDDRSKPFLVMTLDGEGDGLCATVSVVRDNEWTTISKTPAGNSIASFYGAITKHLGMTVNEHEYKVMGLAPYCSEHNRDKTLSKFQNLFTINNDLTFSSQGGGNYFTRWMNDHLRNERFDCVAAAAQKYVEDIACDWVEKAIARTGINNIVLSGGFFMNIKVNKAISELSDIKKIVVCPSAGDESVPLGALYYGLKKLKVNVNQEKYFVGSLYLGSDIDENEILDAIKKYQVDYRFSADKIDDIEERIAKLLASGQVVARVDGPMEFGARALGNRSILGNPSTPHVVKLINDQIKNRDFWMPFACSLLEESADKYLKRVKGVDYSYMAISCDTTEIARKELLGGLHAYDFTARPQLVSKEKNMGYYKVIKEFEAITGIGGILNTSLNLHGEPLVRTPDEALSTFVRSGLQYIAIGKYLISKN